jgi:hypothetical protein
MVAVVEPPPVGIPITDVMLMEQAISASQARPGTITHPLDACYRAEP